MNFRFILINWYNYNKRNPKVILQNYCNKKKQYCFIFNKLKINELKTYRLFLKLSIKVCLYNVNNEQCNLILHNP